MEGSPTALEELEAGAEILAEADAVDGLETPLADVDAPEILAELVVEEVSIDGMCGVY
ncbi:MAG: mycofactocin precursor MftA [Oscillochloridaceae bacterium]|nr:mycofactocin precursor MftA [Chloroflexaceae bacterium]MDW8392000.1 mycofactocin precursor MftA [Oscillochloridaceae bacterium]